jgi:exodeoxyribonuclease VII small subunit
MKHEQTFSLEKALAQLELLEKSFHEPNLDLETSIKKHAEAVALAKDILSYLEKAETELEKIDIASLTKQPEA